MEIGKRNDSIKFSIYLFTLCENFVDSHLLSNQLTVNLQSIFSFGMAKQKQILPLYQKLKAETFKHSRISMGRRVSCRCLLFIIVDASNFCSRYCWMWFFIFKQYILPCVDVMSALLSSI